MGFLHVYQSVLWKSLILVYLWPCPSSRKLSPFYFLSFFFFDWAKPLCGSIDCSWYIFANERKWLRRPSAVAWFLAWLSWTIWNNNHDCFRSSEMWRFLEGCLYKIWGLLTDWLASYLLAKSGLDSCLKTPNTGHLSTLLRIQERSTCIFQDIRQWQILMLWSS